MSEKIGKNIMTLAKVMAWVCGIAALVAGCVWWAALEEFWPFPVCVASGAILVISCWPLYGFGVLIDDVHAMRVHATGAAVPTAEAADELPEL